MTILISNTDFLNGDVLDGQTLDNPIIFYKSSYQPGDITAQTPNLLFPAVNMWNPDTSSFFKGATQPFPGNLTENITIENPDNNNIDSIAIAGHNLGDIPFTVTVRIFYFDGVINQLIDSSGIASNDPLFFYFDPQTADRFLVSVEINITDTLDIPMQIAHIKMGQSTVLQRREFQNVASGYLSKTLRRTQNMSDNGQYLGQVVLSTKREMSLNQSNNTPQFVRDEIIPFIAHTEGEAQIPGASSTTFFYAWRPTTYTSDVLYAWTMDKITPSHQGGDSWGGRMEWSFNMEALT